MKVCYFTHASNVTGANRSLLDMLAGLRGTDVEPVVIIRGKGPLKNELEKQGIAYTIIPYHSTLKSANGIRGVVKKGLNRLSVNRIRRFLERNHIDLLHNNSMMCRLGAEAAYLTGIPYICHLRDMVTEDHRRLFSDEEREKEILQHASSVICISQYVYDKFAPWMPGQKNIRVFYNGINASHYLIRDKEIMTGDTVNISIIGRISENKRQMEAVQAMDILKNKRGYQNLKLQIVGRLPLKRDREYVQRIKEFIEKQGLKTVEMVPFSNEVIEKQRRMDIGLMCSNHEAMGRSTIESMLAGNLTIGARAGATPELIEDGETGLLYESGNPEDLADKIEQALKDPALSRKIAAKGQECAIEKYDIRKYGDMIYELYKSVLS